MNNSDTMATHTQLSSAIKHHQSGNIKEAARIYQQILEDNPDEVDALRLLGIIAAASKDFLRASELVSKAVSVKPDFAEAHGTLGLILGELGKTEESILACRQALELNPRLVDAHFCLGVNLQKRGAIDAAIASLEKAINFNPNHVMSYINLGNILSAKGNVNGAIRCYRRVCQLQPNNPSHFLRLAETIQNIQFNICDDDLKSDLLKCFATKIIPYRYLAVPTSSVVKLDGDFKALLKNTLDQKEALSADYFSDHNIAVLADPLFLQLLKNCTTPDREIEIFLTRVRELILSLALEKNSVIVHCNNKLRAFIYALARQCFFNEYLYMENKKEKDNIKKLHKMIAQDSDELSNEIKIALAVYGCYQPLYKLDNPDKIKDSFEIDADTDFYQIIESQITNPLYELEIRKKITSHVDKKDSITESVQSQYQENPFPRWDSCSIRNPGGMEKEIRHLFPHAVFSNNINYDAPQILIAGCGTGLQAINCSHTYKNAQITAIDLSLTSLSYAIRKTRELGIKNINYIHANILELDKLNMKFDFIESFGVLHHLSKPFDGWKILSGLLKEDGYMMLGLYSEIARDAVVASRELIARKSYPSTLDGIRQCRQEIFEMRDNPLIQRITSPRATFWTTSEVRDLIFHEMEYRYTIPEIAETIKKLGLEFIGFQHHSAGTQANYLKSFPDDPKAISLKNWHEYEKANPRTFSNTYKFWLKKIPPNGDIHDD